eukprot:6750268-Karenia_brevis.AAC.1
MSSGGIPFGFKRQSPTKPCSSLTSSKTMMRNVSAFVSAGTSLTVVKRYIRKSGREMPQAKQGNRVKTM